MKYAAVVFALLAVATPFAAQRPMSSGYDTERQVRLEGAVTISSTSKSSWMPGGEMFEYICQAD